MNKRLATIDYIKTIALLLVFGVHYISWGGYFSIEEFGIRRFAAVSLYLLCHCCVPLFFMASGYLLRNRKLNKDHYMKAGKVVLMYLVASVICGLYKATIDGQSIVSLVKGTVTFSTAGYAWYVEYYILLYMLIPFVNKIVKSKYGNAFILVLVIASTLGALGRYSNIVQSFQMLVLIFKVLKNIFPVMYYSIGIRLREYKSGKFSNSILISFLLIVIVLDTGLYQIIFNGRAIDTIPNGYGTFDKVIIATLIFMLVANLTSSLKAEKVMSLISDSTLIAYLISEVVDLYLKRLDWFSPERPLYWMPIHIILVGSLAISMSIICTKLIFKK